MMTSWRPTRAGDDPRSPDRQQADAGARGLFCRKITLSALSHRPADAGILRGTLGRAARGPQTSHRELLETVGMTAWADRKVGTYSKGMLQRIGLANAMAHDRLDRARRATDGSIRSGGRKSPMFLISLRARGKTISSTATCSANWRWSAIAWRFSVGGLVARHGTPTSLRGEQR